MADVLFGERSKKLIRLASALLYKKLGTDSLVIDQDLRHCQNGVITALNTALLAGANQLQPKWQRETTKKFGQLGLWIIYKDTAYRDVFFWILYQILIRADKILKVIEPYVKEPAEWYPNMWWKSRDITKEQRENGDLPAFGKSMEETIFTPAIQNKRHHK